MAMRLPDWARAIIVISALMQLAFGLTLLLDPSRIAELWPWKLPPLTARLLGASTLVSVPMAALIVFINRFEFARIPLVMMLTYRVLQLLAGDGARRFHRTAPGEILLGLAQLRPPHGDVGLAAGAGLAQVPHFAHRLREQRLGLRHHHLSVRLVEAHERLAALHVLRVLGVDGDDGAGDLRRDLHQVAADVRIDRERILAKHAHVSEADYFAVLGLRRDASTFEVRRAYEAARRDYDPEGFASDLQSELAGPLREIAAILDEAYGVLRDDHIRADYLANLVE